MKNLVHRVRSLALLSPLSFLAFAAAAVAQGQIADSLVRPSDLLEKSRAKQKNMSSAAAATPASGYNFQVLYGFGATATDAKAPETGLIRDASGSLYGTSLFGGAEDASIGGAGTVFNWTQQVRNLCSTTFVLPPTARMA